MRYADDHPYAGRPRRVGKMLECGTQVEFLLSDGTMMPLTMCVECAQSLTPESYGDLMDTVRAAWEESMDDAHRLLIGASPWSEQRMTRDTYRRTFYPLWIVGRLWARRFETANNHPQIDRRIRWETKNSS